MPTNFPGALDDFTNPTGADLMGTALGGRKHAAMHGDVNDAVEELEAKVGTDGDADPTTIDHRLASAGYTWATSTVTDDGQASVVLDVSANKVRAGHTDRVRVYVGGFRHPASCVTVSGDRASITVVPDTLDGAELPFLSGDAVLAEYPGEQ